MRPERVVISVENYKVDYHLAYFCFGVVVALCYLTCAPSVLRPFVHEMLADRLLVYWVEGFEHSASGGNWEQV